MAKHFLLEKAKHYILSESNKTPKNYKFLDKEGYWFNEHNNQLFVLSSDDSVCITKNVMLRLGRIRRVNKVNYLIVSSLYDYSADRVCFELQNKGKHYLRINRDCFKNYRIIYSLSNEKIIVSMG